MATIHDVKGNCEEATVTASFARALKDIISDQDSWSTVVLPCFS